MNWLVVEDDAMYGSLIASLVVELDSDPSVTTCTDLGEALSWLAEARSFDVAILDIELTDASRGGLRIAEHIRDRRLMTKVVFLSQLLTSDAVLLEAITCEPDGLIGKHESLEFIAEALRRVRDGGRVSSAEFRGYLTAADPKARLFTTEELRILEAARYYTVPTRRRVRRRAGLDDARFTIVAGPLLLESSGERSYSGWSVRAGLKLRSWAEHIDSETELRERRAC